MSTPTPFAEGDLVTYIRGDLELETGKILEVDHENATNGGIYNYRLAVIEDGEVDDDLWFTNEDLRLSPHSTQPNCPDQG